MFLVLFHPEMGDDPGSAAFMWLLFAGIVLVAAAALYFIIKFLRSFLARRAGR